MRDRLDDLDRVVVAAPEGEMSGVSHSVTLEKPIKVRWLDESTAAVSGTPTDCVLLAVHGFLREKPDMVVSGINLGPNLGNDVTYSGTVAAALEASILGFNALAISLCTREEADFGSAARFGTKMVEFIRKKRLPPGVFLNVNVPNLNDKDLRGVRVTRLGRRTYRDDVVQLSDPVGEACYKIGGEPVCELEEGTDVQATAEGYISVTPVSLDLTDHVYLEEMCRWRELEGFSL
jgi:5'-nucleotidase